MKKMVEDTKSLLSQLKQLHPQAYLGYIEELRKQIKSIIQVEYELESL
jgi:hypothetical protein